jgi:endonuclease YncB( thermonuclease family)
MKFDHDFVKYPELTDSELQTLGLLSPHEQITQDFEATVVKVHDGDTVTLRTSFRDFDFPLRFLSVDAPELNTGHPGEESRDWLKSQVLGETVQVRIQRGNRVGKYGRLLGDLVVGGVNIGHTMMQLGFALPYGQRREGEIPDLDKHLNVKQWFEWK